MARIKTRQGEKEIKQRIQDKKKSTTKRKRSKECKKIEWNADREKRLEKKREAERKRRRKVRENTELHEIYCKKERERNEARKKAGKLKTVDQLTERQKRIRRKEQNK